MASEGKGTETGDAPDPRAAAAAAGAPETLAVATVHNPEDKEDEGKDAGKSRGSMVT